MFTAPMLKFEIMRFINEHRLNRRTIPFVSNVYYLQFKKVFCDRHISRLLHAPGQHINTVLLSGFTPQHSAHIVMMNVLYDFTYMAPQSKDMEIFSRNVMLKKARHFSMHVGDPSVLPFSENTFDAAIVGDEPLFCAARDQLRKCIRPGSPCLVFSDASDNLTEIHEILQALTPRANKPKIDVVPEGCIAAVKPFEWKTTVTFDDLPSYMTFLFSLPQFEDVALEEHYDTVIEVLTKLYEGKDSISVTVHFQAHEIRL